MSGASDPYPAFRLDLDQQRERAGTLATIPLADAQLAIARELGFGSWSDLEAHAAALAAAREAIAQPGPAVDADMPTLHVRCGSDIQGELAAAGFGGDFLEVWDPFPVGPVTDAPDWIAQRARFHAGTVTARDVDEDALLAELTNADRRLAASAATHARVVIWSEHDSHDQLSLVRCLAHYARTGPPRVLELISVDHFPGSRRFIGLGQLPPEALRMLWHRRAVVDAGALAVGAAAWAGLTSPDPRALAALARTPTPSLPHLGRALRRHLQELPSAANGLSLTQALVLQILDRGPASVNDLWRVSQGELEPLPFLGDTMFLHGLDETGRAHPAVYERSVTDPERPFSDRLTITRTGRAVLRGETDYLSLSPPVRWIGGVRIDPSMPTWRWDEARRDVTLVER